MMQLNVTGKGRHTVDVLLLGFFAFGVSAAFSRSRRSQVLSQVQYAEDFTIYNFPPTRVGAECGLLYTYRKPNSLR